MSLQVDKLGRGYFKVIDEDNNLMESITGFTRLLINPLKQDVTVALNPIVGELSNGHYYIEFTPNMTGEWMASVFQIEYLPAGVSESFYCVSGNIETYYGLTSGQIEDRYSKLSGQVETRYDNLSGVVSTKYTSLSGQIETRYSETSGLFQTLFTDISGVIHGHYLLTSGMIAVIDYDSLSGQISNVYTYSVKTFDYLDNATGIYKLTKRALGLLHENFETTGYIFNEELKALSFDAIVYDVNSGGTLSGIIATYAISGGYDTSGKMTWGRCYKNE